MLSFFLFKFVPVILNIDLFQNIVATIEGSWHTMLEQLLTQLRTDLQLPKCLQIVGYLRRMQAYSLPELKLKFLQARDSWFCSILNGIPKDDRKFFFIVKNTSGPYRQFHNLK